MPAIPLHYLDAVFFIYESADSAEEGDNTGATGFILGYPMPEIPGREFRYLVTCAHVLEGLEDLFLRVNGEDGDPIIYQMNRTDWIECALNDVAICRLRGPLAARNDRSVSVENSMTQEWIDKFLIGPGDDVFMIGKFSSFSGGVTENVPLVRCGTVAMMPARTVTYSTGQVKRRQEAYFVDMGNRRGFSGSPVFIYEQPNRAIFREGMSDEDGKPVTVGGHLLYLFGICAGVYPEECSVFKNEDGEKVKVPGLFTEGSSGMAIVVPVSCLIELLDSEAAKTDRETQTQIELASLQKSEA